MTIDTHIYTVFLFLLIPHLCTHTHMRDIAYTYTHTHTHTHTHMNTRTQFCVYYTTYIVTYIHLPSSFVSECLYCI